MKFAGKKSLSFYMKLLLIVIMAITAAVVAALPWVVEMYLKIDYGIYNSQARTVLLIVLYPCGICAFFVENELRRIFKTLEDMNPFIEANVKSLNRMGFLMVVVFAMFIVKIALLNTIMTMISAFAFIILAIFCFVLADVFRQAGNIQTRKRLDYLGGCHGYSSKLGCHDGQKENQSGRACRYNRDNKCESIYIKKLQGQSDKIFHTGSDM